MKLLVSNILAASLLTMAILLLLGQTHLLANAQALCLSQFALANEACSFVHRDEREAVAIAAEEPGVAALRNRRRDHRGRRSDPEDTVCCRRLSSIDNACVCEAMARLPVFITRPKHVVTITPIKGCDVTYECDGF